MAYNRNNMIWLWNNYVKQGQEIEVLVDCGDSYQWLVLTEGIIIMKSHVFDHRFLGDENSVENLDWAKNNYHQGDNSGVCLV
jgi:hypothetical protein